MSTPVTREAFSNVSNDIPLSIQQMAEDLLGLTGGWPKLIAGQLCMPRGDGVVPILKPAALVAYIDRSAEVRWRKSGVTKEEFYEGLGHSCDEFEWASPHPHFPALPRVYYGATPPSAANTGRLDELVARFSPATDMDRRLIKAMVLTLYWGGPKGKRPVFTITTDGVDDKKGRGAGKSTLAEVLAGLVGGVIGFQARASPDRIRSGLLSPASWGRRMVLLDNLKTTRFSSDEFESLVTCEEVTGHQLYRGFATRPNYLTYVVTVNGASFSKDVAERTVPIHLTQSAKSPTWYAETRAIIDQHRDEIVADVRWHLEKKKGPILIATDRWPDWCREVLSKTDKPNAALKLIEERRRAIDADDLEEEEVLDHIWACIVAAGVAEGTVNRVVRVPAVLMAKWVTELRRDLHQNQASHFLRSMKPGVLRYHRTKTARYYEWRGKDATPETPAVTIAYKVTRDAH